MLYSFDILRSCNSQFFFLILHFLQSIDIIESYFTHCGYERRFENFEKILTFRLQKIPIFRKFHTYKNKKIEEIFEAS